MKAVKIMTTMLVILLIGGCSAMNGPKPNEEDKPADERNQTEDSNKQDNNQTAENKDNYFLDNKYFNKLEIEEGNKVIKNTENIMVLVNKQFMLPPDYIPDDLVRPNVDFSFGDLDVEKSYLRREAAKAMEEMFTAAKQDGVSLFAVSGYRSYERQRTIFNAEVAEKGEEKAVEAVAIPGQSEHQTGLAMDISGASVDYLLVEDFENTMEGTWLRENAHRFGFILRYPKGKESITGYQFEPWHFRYIGKDYAKMIYENNWTLEEFFENMRPKN